MQRHTAPVSLADLSSAGIRLRPYEAATLVRELCRLAIRGDIAGMPSAHVIRLSPAGTLSTEGPVAAGGRSVERAAQLLDSLLPPPDAGNEFRVPGGLKIAVARGLGILDVPSFPSLDAFAEALSRFAASDPRATIGGLVETWAEVVASSAPAAAADGSETLPARVAQLDRFVPAQDPPPPSEPKHALTVSDIRRARRATGISLVQVADRSRIPIGELRQLEWGYLLRWPTGEHGRSQLIRYARATGLDEQLVVATIAPLIAQAQSLRTLLAAPPARRPFEEGILDSGPVSSARHLPPVADVQPNPRTTRSKVLAALAVPALLALALVPAWWAQTSGRIANQEPAAQTTGVPAPPQAGRVNPDGSAPDPGEPSVEPSPSDVGAGSSDEHEAPSAAAGVLDGARTLPDVPRSDVPSASPGAPVSGPPMATASGPPAAGVSGAPATIASDAPRAPAGVSGTSQAASERTSQGAPEAPAYRVAADSGPYPPSFASVGSAMFHDDDDVAEGDGRTALVRADTDSRGPVLRITRIVDDNAQNFHLRPSPDGSRIAFDSDRDGERGVYLADADGKNVRRVSPPGYAAVPSWSPDGRLLAFVRADADRPDVRNVWTLELRTGALRQITRHRDGQAWGGSWFPGGGRMAYSHEDRLVIHDLATGAERVFPSPRKGRAVRTPAVSPDGRRVIFQVDRDGTWLLDVADGSIRRVLDDPTAQGHAWARDGKQVAYHSQRSGGWNVWVMAPR